MNRWFGSLGLLAAGALVVVTGLTSGSVVTSLILLAFLAAVAWWSWPGRRGKHTPHAEAQAAADDDDVIIYWRPG